MPSCRQIDPLFAAYVDGEATADERAQVDAHLRACPKCRHQTALQTIVRDTVREKLCRPSAPDALRTRCRAAARTGILPFRITRSIPSLVMAAALLIVVGGVLLYGLTKISPAVLAAQLTLDHLKCFAVDSPQTAMDARTGEAQYARAYGQQVRLPRADMDGLELVGLRRCFCAEGAAAHAMYRLNGRPVSLYVIPDASRERMAASAFGHNGVIWSHGNVTYVLVGKEPRTSLEDIARAMDGTL
jgi:anti-sigma factor RsiW